MSVGDKAAITFLLLGALLFLISLPLYLGKVKPNGFYGFRLRKAFESDANWYAINHYGAKAMMIWSVVLVIVAVACREIDPRHVMTLSNVGFLSIGIPIVQTLLFARKL